MDIQTPTFEGDKQQAANSQLLLQIPKVEFIEFEYHGGRGKFYFYQEDREHLCLSQGYLRPEVITLAGSWLKASGLLPFRRQLDLFGQSLLFAFYPETQEVFYVSPRANRELFLIKQLEYSNISEDQPDYILFKQHLEKVVGVRLAQMPSEIDLLGKFFVGGTFYPNDLQKIDDASRELIQKLKQTMQSYRKSAFEVFSDFGLGLTAEYALLRVHLLKFLAILPSLDHDQKGTEVKRILLESLRRLIADSHLAERKKVKGDGKPFPASWMVVFYLLKYLFHWMPAGPLATFVRMCVRMMAKRFIAGESIELAESSLRGLIRDGRDATLDQLGELVVSEGEANHYESEVIKLIQGFSSYVTLGEKNKSGIYRAHVSIKVSALCSDFRPQAFEQTYQLVAPRLKRILLSGKQFQVFVNIDAEHYHYRDMVFQIYQKVLLETPELSDYQGTGIVLQAYLRDAYKHFLEIKNLAHRRQLLMPVRLVKGAYWDAETIEAEAHSFDAPQFLNKEETDIHFRFLIQKILESGDSIQLCLASHNILDHCFGETLRQQMFPHSPKIEHQCLHMTYEALSISMAKIGWTVRNYVPVGSLLVGMAYLVRRIMENSSQVGILTLMRSHNDQGYMSPYVQHFEHKKQQHLKRDPSIKKLGPDFMNHPPLRLYLSEHLNLMAKAMENFKLKKMGQTYYSGNSKNGTIVEVVSPNDGKTVVGNIQFANLADLKLTMDQANCNFDDKSWGGFLPLVRASVLLKAGWLMSWRRVELAALIVNESGKAVPEALGDVDEAIDFLNYYAREEVYLHHNPWQGQYIPRGVVAVISPWNFPLAIPCGMVVSHLAAGNTVVFKPAEQTPLIASELCEILYQAGVPKSALYFIPGDGETVGAALVTHPKISFVSFTGSKSVGMWMSHQMNKKNLPHPLSKKEMFNGGLIAEMGGKNAIIVTASAELDESVSGTLYSAFGHAGQKCSAASRVLVHRSVFERFKERIKDACQDLQVGPGDNFGTFMNPIISLDDKKRLIDQAAQAIIEAQKFGGEVVIDRSKDQLNGFAIGPVVVALPADRAVHGDSFAMKELFGPILHLIAFDNLDEAVRIFNCTDYALTGGVFSQSQDDIDFLIDRLEAGNLYINRGNTGARVAIEPFGGFKLSGSGPKAGGKDLMRALHLYCEPQNHLVKKVATYQENGGSDYLFDLSTSVPRNKMTEEHFNSWKKSTGNFIHHTNEIFGGVFENQKEILKKYKIWVTHKLNDWPNFQHANRYIPGQLNFNNYSIIKSQGLMLVREGIPDHHELLYFLSAICVGSGVTVIATCQKSYAQWSEVVSIFHKSGISKNQVQVCYPKRYLLEKTLQDPNWQFCIWPTQFKDTSDLMQIIFNEKQLERNLRQILSRLEAPSPDNFEHYFFTFCHTRSLAVNTMRHGAPLELDIAQKH